MMNSDSTAIVKVPSTLRRMPPTTRGPSTSSEIPLAPGEGRRKGLCSEKDPHGEQVGYVDKGAVGGEAGRVLKMGQTNETLQVGVKGEFVGKIGPSGWEKDESDRTGPPDGKSTSLIGWIRSRTY